MKRTMKKMVSMALTGTMAVAVLAGAGTSEVKAADKAKIGVLVADVSGEEAQGFRSYYENYIAGNYDVEFNYTDALQSAEDEDVYKRQELMLVIDSKELNQQIQSTESTYIEKSKEVLSNGQETEGGQYETKVLNWQKKLFYGVLRIIIRPLRQLL